MDLADTIVWLNEWLKMVLSMINNATGVLLSINVLGFPILGWVGVVGIVADVVSELSPVDVDGNE